MSFIVHRCACGHIDLFHGHNRGEACEMSCRCNGGRDMGPSELLPTTNNGHPVETVAKPGSKPSGYPITALCGCDSCVSLYGELTGNAS